MAESLVSFYLLFPANRVKQLGLNFTALWLQVVQHRWAWCCVGARTGAHMGQNCVQRLLPAGAESFCGETKICAPSQPRGWENPISADAVKRFSPEDVKLVPKCFVK